MSEHDEDTTVHRTVDDRAAVVEREIHHHEPTRSGTFKGFVLGFLTALVLAVMAAVIFLALSDDDDDGQVELDVPTVDIDVDG